MTTITKELAEQEFERFVEAMDIDVDPARMTDQDQKNFDKARYRVIQAFMDGSLVLNDDGEAVYTPQNAKTPDHTPITFYEQTGADLMASDNKKDTQKVSQMYAMMASMCKVPAKTFALMRGRDLKVVTSIFALLMD